VRACYLLAVVLLAGCPQQDAAELADDGVDDPAPDVECGVDADCAPAAASCCECPTFALSVATGWADACADVVDTCADPSFAEACPLTEAVCADGACALRCQAVVCETACDTGFARDEGGCLLCECAGGSPPASECVDDGDCVRTRADCCGCEQGGADTAVPADQQTDFEAGLDCDPSPVCPGVDVCEPGAEPRCVAGSCALAAAPDPGLTPDAGPDDSPGDTVYCGGPYGACPAGHVCVLNDPSASDAADMGVGACQPA
jgi:hypothetical protein